MLFVPPTHHISHYPSHKATYSAYLKELQGELHESNNEECETRRETSEVSIPRRSASMFNVKRQRVLGTAVRGQEGGQIKNPEQRQSVM
jgi:hypothetical protein